MLQTIRAKLMFFAVGMVLLTIVPVILIGSNFTNKAVMMMHSDKVEQEVKLLGQLVNVFYDSINKNIRMLSDNPLLQHAAGKLSKYVDIQGEVAMKPSTSGGLEQKIYEEFGQLGKSHPEIFFVYMGSKDGGYVQWPETSMTSYDPTSRPWYIDAVDKKGEIIITDPYVDEGSSEVVVTVARAIPGDDGSIAGVVAMDINNKMLAGILKQISIGQTGHLMMIHKSGLIFIDSGNKKNNLQQLQAVNITGSEQILKESGASFTTLLNGKSWQVDSFKIDQSDWFVAVFIEESELNKTAELIRKNIFIVSGLVTLAICLITFVVSGRFVRPIRKMMKDLEQSEGDLTMRLQASSKDEIGELASWFNVFMERLANMVREVISSADGIDSSALNLASIAEQLKSSVEITSQKVDGAADATEEMNGTINNVAAAMEESSTNVSVVASAAEGMTATVAEISDSVREASRISENGVTQAKATSSKMEELDGAAQAISKVTEVITEISEQTNLLALNATIEAARAGEAGKGFAVVANEIKELANQTAMATGDIRDKIAGVQNTSSASISAINDIVETIDRINEIIGTITGSIEQQSSATRDIANNINHASLGLAEVSENINQSTLVSASIRGEITGVNRASGEIASNSRELFEQANSLKDLAVNLKKVMSAFTV